MMTNFNWINTYYALIFPYITLGLPLALWIMLSHFSQLSKELDEAALVDGAITISDFKKNNFSTCTAGSFFNFHANIYLFL